MKKHQFLSKIRDNQKLKGEIIPSFLVLLFLFIGQGQSWALNAPPAACPNDFSICINEAPLDLNPLSGFPGAFTGTGVVMNIFYPAIAHAGPHTITHNYMIGINSFSCSFVITVDSTFACFDTSAMKWVFLPPGSTNGSCTSNSNCCQDTLCYGLQYTPASTGKLTSYTTGFFVNCLSGMSPVVSNKSCVMTDNSFVINGCNLYNKVLFNSSGNTGLIPVMANAPIILHKVCFLVPVGDTLHITEDTITDLTASIKLTDTTFVTEHPSFVGFDIYRTGPVAPVNQASTIQCIADATEPPYPPVVDMCGSFIIPSLNSIDSIPDPLTCEGSVIYHFTFTDCSGQSVPWTYTYTIDHTTLPHQSGGPVSIAATVACIALAVPPVLPVIVDVCGDTLTPFAPFIGGTYNGCEGTRTFTYTYIDCSGLPFTWTFTYLIERLDFTLPPDGFLTVSCPAATNVFPLLPTVLDNCGNVLSPSGSPVISPQVICEGTRTYTYTYIDCEGNSHNWVFTYTVERNEFSTPPNGFATVTCPSAAEVVPTPPTVTDNCGNILTPIDTIVSSIPIACEGNKIYLFVYLDCEENMATWAFTYTVERLPFADPADGSTTVACPAQADIPPTAFFPVVLDNCGNTLIPAGPVVTPPVSCEGTRTYTYVYTDCEGNTQDWVFTYTVERQPFTVPADGALTVSCPAAADVVPTAFLPVVLSDCGETLAPVLTDDGDPVICEGTRTYTYKYTDCEGNIQFWSFVYTVDRLPLVNPVDAGATVSCPAGAEVVPTAFLPVVTDNCGLTLSPAGPMVSPPVCVGTRTYTYIYTDCAGNTADWVYTYTILPNTSLAVHCPADLVLTCAANINYVSLINAWLATATATDACDANPVITNNYDGMSIPSFSCMGGLPITFTATDACGNTATCTALVTKPCFNLESWVYLEGAAASPSGGNTYTLPMRTTLNDLRLLPGQLSVDPFLGNHYSLPGQPYTIAPWLYPGTEGALFDSGNNPMFANAGYPSTVVDWVLVSIRTDSAGTGGPACQAAALLHKDGSIQFVQPLNCCSVNENNQYFVVIEHRNHLIVMSHVKQSFINHKLSYDFRFQQSYEDPIFAGFNLFAREKEIISGKFAMYAGNGNQTPSFNADTDINFDDRSYWEGQNGLIGSYRIGDYNLNGDTNFNDRITWERNNGKFTSVPRN
ncbi:MAG: hypothetical protein WBP41_12535 [Saprospiraceae bacterium]